MRRLGVPASVHGSFWGAAKVFQQSFDNEPILVADALLAVYIVLGVLYESHIHRLLVSQMLTLYTTPVIYLCVDRFRLRAQRRWRIRHPRFASRHLPEPGE